MDYQVKRFRKVFLLGAYIAGFNLLAAYDAAVLSRRSEDDIEAFESKKMLPCEISLGRLVQENEETKKDVPESSSNGL